MSNDNTRATGLLSVWFFKRGFGFILVEHSAGDALSREKFYLHGSHIRSGKPEIDAVVHFEINPIREGSNRSALNAVIVNRAGV